MDLTECPVCISVRQTFSCPSCVKKAVDQRITVLSTASVAKQRAGDEVNEILSTWTQVQKSRIFCNEQDTKVAVLRDLVGERMRLLEREQQEAREARLRCNTTRERIQRAQTRLRAGIHQAVMISSLPAVANKSPKMQNDELEDSMFQSTLSLTLTERQMWRNTLLLKETRLKDENEFMQRTIQTLISHIFAMLPVATHSDGVSCQIANVVIPNNRKLWARKAEPWQACSAVVYAAQLLRAIALYVNVHLPAPIPFEALSSESMGRQWRAAVRKVVYNTNVLATSLDIPVYADHAQELLPNLLRIAKKCLQMSRTEYIQNQAFGVDAGDYAHALNSLQDALSSDPYSPSQSTLSATFSSLGRARAPESLLRLNPADSHNAKVLTNEKATSFAYYGRPSIEESTLIQTDPGTHNLNNTNRDTYTNPSHIRNRELAVLEYYDRSSSDNDSDEWSDHNDEDWEDIAPNANDPNSEPEVRRLDKVIMVDEAMEYF